MEGILAKTGNDYILYSKDNSVLGITSGTIEGRKLSLHNCQAIERGYDLDELAKESSESQYLFSDLPCYETGFIRGFQKALEVNADKRFTLKEMLECWNRALEFQIHKETLGEYIKSLKQTEWDVEIVMEDIIHLKNRRGGLANMGKPKLDADECLILKRKL